MQVVARDWAAWLSIMKVNVSKEMTNRLMLLESEVQGRLRQLEAREGRQMQYYKETYFKVHSYEISNIQPALILKSLPQ